MKIERRARLGRFSYLRLFAGRAEYWRTLFDGPARVSAPLPDQVVLVADGYRATLDRAELRAIAAAQSKGEPLCR